MNEAKEIRVELKNKLGYNSRQVSVRTDGCAIRVNVKDKSIDLKPIKEIARKYEDISRCEYTHEILSGGNTFVFVNYSWDAK
jgi:hypothetical protein